MSTPRWFLSLVTGPAEEPVSLADAKLHLRFTSSAEDTLIMAWLQAARDIIEQCTGRALMNQRWALTLNRFPDEGEAIIVPKPPLTAVVSIKYYDTANVQQTWASDRYQVLKGAGGGARRAQIVPVVDVEYPDTEERLDAVEVTFDCGAATAASVPPALKAAILLLIGHFFVNREAVQAGGLSELPLGVQSLLDPYVVMDLV